MLSLAQALTGQSLRYLTTMQEHRSFPSIITWVVFNEGWGQYATQQVVSLAQSLDSSRLIDPASGWVDSEVGLPIT